MEVEFKFKFFFFYMLYLFYCIILRFNLYWNLEKIKIFCRIDRIKFFLVRILFFNFFYVVVDVENDYYCIDFWEKMDEVV